MTIIPKFKLYGEDDVTFAERVQNNIPLRPWSSLTKEERSIMHRDLVRCNWISENPRAIIDSVEQLNFQFKRILPAKNTFNILPNSSRHMRISTNQAYINAAITDFELVFIVEESEDLVLFMISLFARSLIDQTELKMAQRPENIKDKKNLVESAYEEFDNFSNRLNYLFEQFSVNIVVSRCGIIPKQDDRVTKNIYEPTLKILSDPKWESVNSILRDMYSDYQNRKYPEVITNAHNAVHRFLQIALGINGNVRKGEFGKLFNQAKMNELISNNSEVENIVKGIKGFLPSERAKKSTAKPASQTASSADALLAMNISMVLIQHCLQNMDQVK